MASKRSAVTTRHAPVEEVKIAYDFAQPLADPENASIDIVFVHGVGGDPRSSWTSRASNFWPQTLLPSAIPEARILSWGYKASLFDFWNAEHSTRKLADYGCNLLRDLDGVREDEPDRPIIFVAHSLGGIVCASALVHALSFGSQLQNVANRVRGIVFIGTPLRSTAQCDFSDLATRFFWLFDKQASAPRDLGTKSRILQGILDRFTALIGQRSESLDQGIRIACFYEAKKTFKEGKSIGRIVEPQSAILDGCKTFGVFEDHENLARWDTEDEGPFLALTDTIRTWVSGMDEFQKPAAVSRTPGLQGAKFSLTNRGGAVLGSFGITGNDTKIQLTTVQNRNVFNYGVEAADFELDPDGPLD